MHYKELGVDVMEQIIYRGEGNSSIVIALKDQAKVIRLLKKDGKIMRSSQDYNATHYPLRSLKFIHLIMKPLTKPFLSTATELIYLKSDFINLLSNRVEIYRPLHRLDKTLVLDDQYALIMDDLCTIPTSITNLLSSKDDLCGPTISIEIKPKQGFLPLHRFTMRSSPTINDQPAMKLRNCCIYGLNQHLKLSRGRIQQLSNYCPINLFSGCPNKMMLALKELIHNPQNNLRIFKDLRLAYGESNQTKLSHILEDFFDTMAQDNENIDRTQKQTINCETHIIDLIIRCLLNDHVSNTQVNPTTIHEIFYSNWQSPTSPLDDENSFCISNTCSRHSVGIRCRCCDNDPSEMNTSRQAIHRLPNSCVLSSVLRAQKLDTIGAHKALHMLETLLKDCETNRTEFFDGNIIEKLNEPHAPANFGFVHQLSNETKEEYYFRKVWEFLVSLTAKDCSIIVTLRQITPGRYDSIIENSPELRQRILKDKYYDTYYLFNVGIADLDQKMPSKIPRICENLNLIFQSTDLVIKETFISHQLQSINKLLVNYT